MSCSRRHWDRFGVCCEFLRERGKQFSGRTRPLCMNGKLVRIGRDGKCGGEALEGGTEIGHFEGQRRVATGAYIQAHRIAQSHTRVTLVTHGTHLCVTLLCDCLWVKKPNRRLLADMAVIDYYAGTYRRPHPCAAQIPLRSHLRSCDPSHAPPPSRTLRYAVCVLGRPRAAHRMPGSGLRCSSP